MFRAPPICTSQRTPFIEVDGVEYLSFSSNDYLGLASDPSTISAMQSASAYLGVGSSASRLVTGTLAAHRSAESALATFIGQQDAVLFTSGYAANVGTLSALAGAEDALFSDALNHASIIDGARLSRAKTYIYPHCDLNALSNLLAKHRKEHRRAFIVSESRFSMDGDAPQLTDLARIASLHDATMYLDEAHSLGIDGPDGRGLAAAAEVQPEVLVGPLGKSFGLSGAFVACSSDIATIIRHKARSYVFSTAPSPPIAAAIPTAVHLLRNATEQRRTLARHSELFRRLITEAVKRRSPEVRGPIQTIRLDTPQQATETSHALKELGVFVQAIRPPTVPKGTSRLRIVFSSSHTQEHVRQLASAISQVVSAVDR
ncbi:MAG: 8-amino-7-oxononanoate synthase [Myxococcota bacterium]